MKVLKFLPIYLIFLVMGMVDAVGPMVSLAKESFLLSITVATALPFIGYLLFGLFSIPVGVLQNKKGKVFVINLGLGIMLLGLFLPIVFGMYGKLAVDSSSLNQFYKILLSTLFMGAGGAILQVAGNPFVRDISGPGEYSSNLSLAQSFITIGSSLGFLVPTFMFNIFKLDWTSLFPIYSAIAILALFMFNTSRFANKKSQIIVEQASLKSCIQLLTNRYVVFMMFGIFIYCGLEIAIASHTPILLNSLFQISLAEMGLLVSWSLFYLPIFFGRFLGSYLLKFLKPANMLMYSVVVAIVGIVIILTSQQIWFTLTGVLICGLGFSNIFPLIFSITIDSMPEKENQLSGLMVTMIAGGAFLPMLMGVLADKIGIQQAFIIPLLSVGYLLFLALLNMRRKYVKQAKPELKEKVHEAI